jgi:hypothetical protein
MKAANRLSGKPHAQPWEAVGPERGAANLTRETFFPKSKGFFGKIYKIGLQRTFSVC